jgi:hypothetical protein
MKKYGLFFTSSIIAGLLITGCTSTTVNNLGAYDLSYSDSQQCLLIIPPKITVHTIDGDTVQWNWKKIETRVNIPLGVHVFSISSANKKINDISFDFKQGSSYTFSIKKRSVTIIETK